MAIDDGLTERTRATRDKIVQAARQVFEQDGFDAASVATMVTTAGVSRGTFYLYFDSKEAVLHAVLDGVQAEILKAQEIPDDFPPQEIIRGSTANFLTFYRDNARMMAVLESVASRDPEFRDTRLDMRRGAARRAERFIDTLQRSGQAATSLNSRYAAIALNGMIDRFAYVWFVLEADFEFDEAVDNLSELWMRAIGGPLSEARHPR